MSEGETLICPHCKGEVPWGARVCRGCHAEIQYGPGPAALLVAVFGGLATAAIGIEYLNAALPARGMNWLHLIVTIGSLAAGIWVAINLNRFFTRRHKAQPIFKRHYRT